MKRMTSRLPGALLIAAAVLLGVGVGWGQTSTPWICNDPQLGLVSCASVYDWATAICERHVHRSQSTLTTYDDGYAEVCAIVKQRLEMMDRGWLEYFFKSNNP